MELIGNIIIALGTFFILFGIIGIFKFDNFYTRILVAAKIDIVGIITIIIGVVVKHGFSFFSAKSLLLLGILMIITPLASHMIARAAYLSGYQVESGDGDKKIADDGGNI